MKRVSSPVAGFVLAISLLVLCLDIVQPQHSEWESGKEISSAVAYGPLIATREYEVVPIGTFDVFGNGTVIYFARENLSWPTE